MQAYFVTRETLRRLKQSQNPCFAKDWKPAAHPDSPKWPPLLRAKSDAEAGLGDPVAAEKSIRRAIAISVKVFGPDNSDLGTAYNSLGLVLGEQGRHRESIEALSRSNAIQGSSSDAPMESAIRKNNLASAYESAGDYPQALALYKQAVDGLAGLDDGSAQTLRLKLQMRQARAEGVAGEPAKAFERLSLLRVESGKTQGEASIDYAFATLQLAALARLLEQLDGLACWSHAVVGRVHQQHRARRHE